MAKSQTDRIIEFLGDRKWHSGLAIAEYLVPGGSCVAYRSRIACDVKPKLHAMGLTVFSRMPNKGKIWEYRIGAIGELPL